MPGNIKAKDLQYDSSLPPFLQRLHDQNAGRTHAERHERAAARPKKVKESDVDDEPTIVDESGDLLTKDELEKLQSTGTTSDDVENTEDVRKPDELKSSVATSTGETTKATKHTDQNATDGAARVKRKLAKVVGSDSTADDKESRDTVAMRSAKKMKKKNTRPVKLAFNDDDGGI